MMPPWSTVELISADHQCDSFTSGVESGIDDWFKKAALNEQLNHRTSTWVCRDDSGKIIAFFSLCTVVCDLSNASKRHQKSLCGQGTTMAPATLLAKMGVHREFQGKGLGRALVLEAFRQATTADDENVKSTRDYKGGGWKQLAPIHRSHQTSTSPPGSPCDRAPRSP